RWSEKEGKTVSWSNSFVMVADGSGPPLTPDEALLQPADAYAVLAKDLGYSEGFSIVENDTYSFHIDTFPSVRHIEGSMVYYFDGDFVHLAYEFTSDEGQHCWLIHVNARTGQILRKIDLVLGVAFSYRGYPIDWVDPYGPSNSRYICHDRC